MALKMNYHFGKTIMEAEWAFSILDNRSKPGFEKLKHCFPQ